MILADSNLVIYASKSGYEFLDEWFASAVPCVSTVSYVEALGFHKLVSKEKEVLESFFAKAPLLEITNAVLKRAVSLRQMRKMKLGDSLIAGTALVHCLTLATHNKQDFQWVPNLSLFDPFDQWPKEQPKEGT